MRKILSYLNKLVTYYEVFGVLGFFYAVWAKFMKGSREITIFNKEIKTPIVLRLNTSDIATYRDIFLVKEYQFSPKKTPKVIIDAGANIGLASLYFVSQYPEAKIIALEPESSNFEILKKNTEKYPNITVLNAALWNENVSLNIVDKGFDNWGFQAESIQVPSGHKICNVIEGLTVDQIMRNHSLPFIDLLKLDIEGGEKEIFEKPPVWLKYIDTLVVELHDRFKIGCNRNFYNNTNNFKKEWQNGENVFLSENSLVSR